MIASERISAPVKGVAHRSAKTTATVGYVCTGLAALFLALDTVYEAGYFDQAHLTRSVKTLIGQTPVQIGQGRQQLSFLYKTTPPPRIYDAHGRFDHDRVATNHRPG